MQAKLASIRLDGGTQSREKIDQDTVGEFAQSMQLGANFPPILIFYDGKNYWLADGFHRVHAALALGLETIKATVRQGTQKDASWESCGANKTHGLKRTNEDKRRAVEMALRLCPEKSDRMLADHCGVDHKTVAKLRPQTTGEVPQSEPQPRTGRDGRTINTANIGRPKDTEPEEGGDTEDPITELGRLRYDHPPREQAATFCDYAKGQLIRMDEYPDDPTYIPELKKLILWIEERIKRKVDQ